MSIHIFKAMLQVKIILKNVILQSIKKGVKTYYTTKLGRVLSLPWTSLDLSSLIYGLHQSFVDKHKYVKQNVAAEMESVALRLYNYVNASMKETFHEFLRSSTSIISNNIYSEKNNTVKLLSPLIKNDKIVILAANKESCTVIRSKCDYIRKINNIIEEGMQKVNT